MKAFISWSGSRERQIAIAFGKWLEAVAPEVRPFISPQLPKGKGWFDALAKELKDARIGFMCLAPPRVASEWQLVEAGAIWKAARGGGLFPLCFGVGRADIPEPLREFQLTQFEEGEFRQLAADIARVVGAQQRDDAFGQAWPALRSSVEDALDQPDDGVHTTRGLIHELAGGWWERVWSSGGETKLSWMWIEPSADGCGQTITGRGFGQGGSMASRWQTDLVSVQAELPEPILSYYWEGRHPAESSLLFGGKCWIRFTVSGNGRIEQGAGEFTDVCLNEARPPMTKLIDLLKATPEELAIMSGKDDRERCALAERKLQAWP